MSEMQLGLFGDVYEVAQKRSKNAAEFAQMSLFDTRGEADQMLLFSDGATPVDMVYAPAVADVSCFESDRCLCGGKLSMFDGIAGYQAAVCGACGEHWSDLSKADHAKHVERYQAGARNA